MKKIELIIISVAFFIIKIARILFWTLTWITFPVWSPFWYIYYLITFSNDDREWLGPITLAQICSDFIDSSKNVFNFKRIKRQINRMRDMME